jgi:hypothetical protein
MSNAIPNSLGSANISSYVVESSLITPSEELAAREFHLSAWRARAVVSVAMPPMRRDMRMVTLLQRRLSYEQNGRM